MVTIMSQLMLFLVIVAPSVKMVYLYRVSPGPMRIALLNLYVRRVRRAGINRHMEQRHALSAQMQHICLCLEQQHVGRALMELRNNYRDNPHVKIVPMDLFLTNCNRIH